MFSAILLPVDFAHRTWERPLAVAQEMARNHDSDLHLLTIVPDFGTPLVGSFFPEGFEEDASRRAAEEFAPLLAQAEGIRCHTHVAHGSVYDQIIRHADRLRCDLIVIGAHRPELRDYLLGPNAARVVRHATQSVIVVRDQ